ncbi:MAG: F0F1 ATP synthase subunit delta [Candidatus Roizmanbacteria bacterium]|uniref:Uncharacterized protein n=1 Tax=Candidatus Roizmanbacteria bacterium CG_4_9_14_0_2_um_filter_39_13 TaxID=1974839 RepID=A0A2M8EXE2_9BACT|nr:F0F1 ATP synthase subunit delta [Candidatus Roizmanbacteria bacterium]PIZ65406.1 MAG: hypothetical protein COY15_03205 [Candidatus Roizmanbacteria bacterium CG_4_10_14_0_2_um_filter_39_12]PJC30535.1 MAG: hypothetical protein CO051_05265 [Candidatus Roizmanbacteria bacterium CG_4_9_14_0_2_um_filter_39_13]
MEIDPVLKEELKQYILAKTKGGRKPQVTIRAAYKLTDHEIDLLKERIEILRKADISVEVEKDILAGFVIQFDSSVIDLSLNSELKSLEHTLYETA